MRTRYAKPWSWSEWTDADLEAARDDIMNACAALETLCEDWDDIPDEVKAAYQNLDRVARYFQQIDRDKLRAWNELHAGGAECRERQ